MPPNSSEDSENAHNAESKPERKMPDFIYVDSGQHDETQNLGTTTQDPRQMFGSIQTMAKGKHPFYLRALALIGTFIMLFLSAIVFIVLLITFVLSVIFLRQSTYFNEQVSIAWKCFKRKAMVFTLGCFVCIFHLSLGIGIVLMYFLLTGEKFNNRFVQEFTQKHK